MYAIEKGIEELKVQLIYFTLNLKKRRSLSGVIPLKNLEEFISQNWEIILYFSLHMNIWNKYIHILLMEIRYNNYYPRILSIRKWVRL